MGEVVGTGKGIVEGKVLDLGGVRGVGVGRGGRVRKGRGVGNM